MSWTVSLVWILSDLLLVLVLWRGSRNRMLGEYVPFYVNIGFVLLVSLSRRGTLLAFDPGSDFYRQVYQWPTFVGPLLRAWILADIYRRVIGYYEKPWRGFAESITVVGMLTFPVALGAFSLEEVGRFFSVHLVTLVLQMGLCLQVYRAAVRVRYEIDLGPNLKGMLAGISLIVGLQAVNFVSFAFSLSSPRIFWFFVQFIYLVALILFAYAMWDLSPMSRPDPVLQGRLREVNSKLHRVARTMLAGRR